MYGSGKELLDGKTIFSYFASLTTVALVVRIKVAPVPVAETAKLEVVEHADPVVEPEAHEAQAFDVTTVPDAAPMHYDPNLKAYVMVPCRRDAVTGDWIFDVDDLECLAASLGPVNALGKPELSQDCPTFCDGRWLQEYYIPADDWESHQKCTRIAVRFPTRYPLAEENLRVFHDPNKFGEDARWSGVQVRLPREQLTESNMYGEFLAAKLPFVRNLHSVQLLEHKDNVLVLTFDDRFGDFQPNRRFALCFQSSAEPVCQTCHVLDRADAAICAECGDQFHFACIRPVAMTAEEFYALGTEDWYCEACKHKVVVNDKDTKKVEQSKLQQHIGSNKVRMFVVRVFSLCVRSSG